MRTPTHTLHASQSHSGWDRSREAVLSVPPGTTIELDVADASGGQLGPDSVAEALTDMDMGRVNPTTGPVRVEGAMPGDALQVRIHELRPSGWGWTGLIPGFGSWLETSPRPRSRTGTISRRALSRPPSVTSRASPSARSPERSASLPLSLARTA